LLRREIRELREFGRATGYTGVPVSVEPTANGELDRALLPAAGPVRAIEPRRDLLPGLPLPSGIVVAGGGILASLVALATLRVLRGRRLIRGGKRQGKDLVSRKVVAKRSFLVDVHLLRN
jgi:hypothetical protein